MFKVNYELAANINIIMRNMILRFCHIIYALRYEHANKKKLFYNYEGATISVIFSYIHVFCVCAQNDQTLYCKKTSN